MTADRFRPTPVHEFADRAWDEFLEHAPVWATVQGDDRWLDRLDDPSAEGRTAFMAVVDALQKAGMATERPAAVVKSAWEIFMKIVGNSP